VDTGGKVLDGIDIPDGCKFEHANLLTAHMFHARTGCQSMRKLLMVSAPKGRTIKTILEAEFPHLEGPIDKFVSFKTMAYLQANILLTTSYHTPTDELMEQARSYQASLEDMYINDHPHVGSIIHPDYRRVVSVLRGHPGHEGSKWNGKDSRTQISQEHRASTTATTRQ
jgi:hypothetical protein